MAPSLRKLALTAHVTASVGWLGAVVAYLALAVAAFRGQDAQAVRAAYLSMDLVIRWVVVPASLAALGTGLVQSLGTEWGLFRHRWVVAKLVLTVAAVGVLLGHLRAVGRMAAVAAGALPEGADVGRLRVQLVVHAAGGLGVLLAATVLSVYKPWGRTAWGRRVQQLRHAPAPAPGPSLPSTAGSPAAPPARAGQERNPP